MLPFFIIHAPVLVDIQTNQQSNGKATEKTGNTQELGRVGMMAYCPGKGQRNIGK